MWNRDWRTEETNHELLYAEPKSVKNETSTSHCTDSVHLSYPGIRKKMSTEFYCKAWSPRDLSDLSEANGE